MVLTSGLFSLFCIEQSWITPMPINYKNHARYCNKAEFILSNFVITCLRYISFRNKFLWSFYETIRQYFHFLNLWFSNEAVFNIFFIYRSLFCPISNRRRSYFKFHKIKGLSSYCWLFVLWFIARIYQIKQSLANSPFIVHLSIGLSSHRVTHQQL